jgi:phage-related baseplate assembly protein
MADALDLTTYKLPYPVIVRELSYDDLLAARKKQFATLWAALQASNPNLPDISALNLEGDPGAVLLEDAAFGDLLYVSDLNDTARVVRLVDFAKGSDLDLHAAEFADPDFKRFEGEVDADLRARIKARRRGSSAAGPDDWFAYHALSADPDVAEVAVSEPGGAVVQVAVRSKSGTGVPSDAVLAKVTSVLTSRAMRPRCRQVNVVPCALRTVPLSAAIWLYPDTPIEVFTGLRDSVPGELLAARKLGRDVTRTSLFGYLGPQGVHSVDLISPASDLVVDANELVYFDPVSITLAGRKW